MGKRRGTPWMATFGLLAALTLGACSSDHDSGSSTSPTDVAVDESGSNAGSSGAGQESSAAVAHTQTVDKSVYYAGFQITVKTMSYTPAANGSSPQVSLDMLFANDGTELATPDTSGADFDLGSGDHHYQPLSAGRPLVPGNARSEAKVAFEVDSDFQAGNAVLTIGTADYNQAVIPLGSTGTLTSNTPKQLRLATSATAGPLKVTITGAELRADLPRVHEQAEKGKSELIVNFDATALSGGTDNDYPIIAGYDAFTLIGSDGNIIKAYGSNDYYGDAASVNVDKGQTHRDAHVVFTIPTPPSSGTTYTLELKPQLDDDTNPVGKATLNLES